jgi:glycosyltransferase involved in cell wall biosynthesis
MAKIGIICSSKTKIHPDTTKGTEIGLLDRFEAMAKINHGHDITVFAARDSQIPLPLDPYAGPQTRDRRDMAVDKHITYELDLISWAFSRQNEFDLFQVAIGNGDIALPFLRFVKKPVVVTLHYTVENEHTRQLYAAYRDYPNLHVVSISDFQRTLAPNLPYVRTIYNGTNVDSFELSQDGGDSILWAGRGVYEKGLDIAFALARKHKYKMQFHILEQKEEMSWYRQLMSENEHIFGERIHKAINTAHYQLPQYYQNARVFLHTARLEEPFGKTLIEAMACGTPVVAFDRGAIAEIVQDGVTGFVVPFDESDRRRQYTVSQSGQAGLQEAIERVYAMQKEQYRAMREACGARVRDVFSREKMAQEYLSLYEELL